MLLSSVYLLLLYLSNSITFCFSYVKAISSSTTNLISDVDELIKYPDAKYRGMGSFYSCRKSTMTFLSSNILAVEVECYLGITFLSEMLKIPTINPVYEIWLRQPLWLWWSEMMYGYICFSFSWLILQCYTFLLKRKSHWVSGYRITALGF